MTDWYVGQKVVCVSNKIHSRHFESSGKTHEYRSNKFIAMLVVGKVYTIDAIKSVFYDDLNTEAIAFLLSEIDTNYSRNGYPQIDNQGEEFYHFWNGRFNPLEEKETDISIFQGLLQDVNDGKVKFDDEPGEHMKPKRQVEFT